jgi:hypothetical protein
VGLGHRQSGADVQPVLLGFANDTRRINTDGREWPAVIKSVTSGGSQASRTARPLKFAVGIDGVPFKDPAGRLRAPPAFLFNGRNDFSGSSLRGSIVVVDLGGLMEHVHRHLRIGPVSHHALPDDLVEPAGKPIGYREVHAFRHPLPILAVVL